eukprot:910912-Prorocentrum_minimum.AAC.3
MHDEVPLVHARVAPVLPHHRLDGHVSVHERVVVPQLPVPPVEVQVLDEEAGRHVPHVVGHVPAPVRGPHGHYKVFP